MSLHRGQLTSSLTQREERGMLQRDNDYYRSPYHFARRQLFLGRVSLKHVQPTRTQTFTQGLCVRSNNLDHLKPGIIVGYLLREVL